MFLFSERKIFLNGD